MRHNLFSIRLLAYIGVFVSFLWRGEWRIPRLRANVRYVALAGGIAAFSCFAVAAILYPGGGYNPFLQMLSALGRTEVRGVEYPACHYWFMAGMFLSAASVGAVWAHLARNAHGWRRFAIGVGGALNATGLCAIAFVPENVNLDMHNASCLLAVAGGVAILSARFRRGADLAWTIWFAVVVAFFAIFLNVDAIPFSPWVPTTQKILIVSFAVWAEWLVWLGF